MHNFVVHIIMHGIVIAKCMIKFFYFLPQINYRLLSYVLYSFSFEVKSPVRVVFIWSTTITVSI